MLILQKKLSYTLTMCVDVHFLGAVGEHREFLAKGFVLSFSDGLRTKYWTFGKHITSFQNHHHILVWIRS
jgi:hypothetical protein